LSPKPKLFRQSSRPKNKNKIEFSENSKYAEAPKLRWKVQSPPPLSRMGKFKACKREIGPSPLSRMESSKLPRPKNRVVFQKIQNMQALVPKLERWKVQSPAVADHLQRSFPFARNCFPFK
jgi:hypothetical protein